MEVRVEGRMGPVCIVQPCALHGGPFELVKGDAIVVAYSEEGEPVGRLCSSCTRLGEGDLGERMLTRARRLRTEAEELERLAGEGSGCRLPRSCSVL
jgi:3-methyladenine DNA glycosylase AlkC